MKDLVHNYIIGSTAVNIAESIENAVRTEKLKSGDKLPTVRALASYLHVAPATVAAAFRQLQARGVLVSQGRRGTRVSHRPVHRPTMPPCLPKGVRNLYDGNPDRDLLPNMSEALQCIDANQRLYGECLHHEPFIKRVARELAAGGVATGELCVVSGALDGIERVLAEQLRPGDSVIVEDPGFGNIFDLVMSQGLSLVPVAIDQEGIIPDELEKACAEGAKALIIAPRGQNPTGAAMSESRGKELKRILRRVEELLIIEDDHAGWIVDAPLHCLHDANRGHWVHVRSLSKAISPDLRLAVMTGDRHTMTKVLDRQIVGERWVSHILQRIADNLLADGTVRRGLRAATKTYARRRESLLRALDEAGIPASGASGYNVWLPVAEETATVQALLAAGWGVSAGERFRLNAPPAIRVTAATLKPQEAVKFAYDLSKVLNQPYRPQMV